MNLFKVTVTPEQEAAMQERITEAFALMTRALTELDRSYRFGRSAEHPGLIDVTDAATHHMGVMVDQVRSLNEDRVAELRAANFARQ
ncbi:hypothetical protein ACIG8S_24815 [[Kitasatospora] papulosa]|uniref:hypothetical protein n=1 Tax=[Kitasatospora] papulosa TaxID=1464011 RepID=UPI0037D3F886